MQAYGPQNNAGVDVLLFVTVGIWISQELNGRDGCFIYIHALINQEDIAFISIYVLKYRAPQYRT